MRLVQRDHGVALWERYCCDECRRLDTNEHDRLGLRVKHEAQPCEVCGKSFIPRRAGARTCSDACRQGAHRRRKFGNEE
jgi:hypothetical protein